MKAVLLNKYDWNTPKLQFNRKTVGRSVVGNHVMYDAILDEVPSITMTTLIRQGCLKYMGSEASAASNKAPAETIDLPVVSEDLLDDALQSSSEEDDVDPTPGDGWSSGRCLSAVDSALIAIGNPTQSSTWRDNAVLHHWSISYSSCRKITSIMLLAVPTLMQELSMQPGEISLIISI